MDRILRTFDQFADADEADWQFYESLSPQERLNMLLEIIAQTVESSGEATERLERIYRVIELSED